MRFFDEYDPIQEDDYAPQPSIVECKRCGKSGLHWEETDEGWRLYDVRDRKHVCSNKRFADDFEVIK